MDGFKAQRKPVMYGKKTAKRQLPRYDLFDRDSDNEPAACQSSTTFTGSAPLSPSSSGPETSNQQKPASVASSLFDLQSSDDEMAGNASSSRPTIKRRRLTPVGRGKGQLERAAEPIGRSNGSVKGDQKVSKPAGTSGVKKKVKTSPAKQVNKQTTSLKSVPRPQTATSRQTAIMRAYESIEIEPPANIASLASSPTPPHTPARRSPLSYRDSSSPSAQLIEQLTYSIGLEKQSSKRARRTSGLSQQTDMMTLDSPSKLGLKSLRLTPEGVSPEEDGRKLSPQPLGMLTPSRSRRRLIDALDSPRRRTQSQDNAAPSPSSIELSPPSKQQTTSQTQKSRDDDAPLGCSLKSSTSTTAAAASASGPKVTYAKQRSHLSDMVLEDMAELAAPSIAHLAEPIEPARSTVTSSFGSQHAQDGEDDDDQGGAAIKSIHELRQAGTNARFQSILESMFEDIEAPGRSLKARRLRGLMSMAQKLAEPGSALLFLEHGMHQRFVTYASQSQDLLSSFLILCVSSNFFTANAAPLIAYQQLFDISMLHSLPLLQETRELSKWLRAMSKDRKQNLSGATCQDIIEYQLALLKSPMWTDMKPQVLSPCLLALRSIEIMISGTRKLKDLETAVSLPIITVLVEILEDVVQGNTKSMPTEPQLTILKVVMSILEYAALSPTFIQEESEVVLQRLVVLRVLLDKATMLSREGCNSIQKLALRLIISVTNNNGYLSAQIGQELMLEQIFAIVQHGFLDLSDAADMRLTADESRLELLILALACLINFIECSSKAAELLGGSGKGHDNLEWLVMTFQLQADRAMEASSIEQAQALVPFGYLSMLLCTLCTVPGNRMVIRDFMKQKSLATLLRAVEELLMYFRTVEQVQVDEDASNNFTGRFESILMSVRKGDLNDVATA